MNHNGSIDVAHQLIEAAAAAGADAVKFQTFRAADLARESAPSAAYQRAAMGEEVSQYDMLCSLELSQDQHFELQSRCHSLDIDFLSSPFDRESLNFLVGPLGLKTIKIPSGEITNGPLIWTAAAAGCQLLISTGMSTLGEIEDALNVVLLAHRNPDRPPTPDDLRKIGEGDIDYGAISERVTILHCTSEYPAQIEDVNLKAIPTMAEHFGLAIGYSDHTSGILIASAAVAMGARVVEKHFTLDRELPGPDHAASLDPSALTEMISEIRMIERALGDGEKTPRGSELNNLHIVRKGLVASAEIAPGEMLTAENVTMLRPADGASPMAYWDWVGKPAPRRFKSGEPIS